MVLEIQLPVFHGIALHSAADGEEVRMASAYFLHSEDPLFKPAIEGLLNMINANLPDDTPVAEMKNMLVLIDQSNKARVYVNELRIYAEMQSRRDSIEAGQEVTTEDILGVESIRFEGVEIGTNQAYLHFFGFNGRQGLSFDLLPLRGLSSGWTPTKRIAKAYSYLFFFDRLTLSRSQLNVLSKQGWFPFVGLTDENLNALINASGDVEAEEKLLDQLAEKTLASLKVRVPAWDLDVFKAHKPFILTALDRFEAKDYLSCISLLIPRIEGILRTHVLRSTSRSVATHESLVKALEELDIAAEILMPREFTKYLRKVYLKHFGEADSSEDISRHTIGHGVALAEAFDFKWSLIALLIVEKSDPKQSRHTKDSFAQGEETSTPNAKVM